MWIIFGSVAVIAGVVQMFTRRAHPRGLFPGRYAPPALAGIITGAAMIAIGLLVA